YAAALLQRGIQADELVMIAHPQSMESIYAFWGALLIGAIPSMFPTLTEKLDPTIYMQNLSELVGFSGVKAIITADDFALTLSNVVNCPVISSLEQLTPAKIEIARVNPAAIAFLQHSSGTTGLQKGVALSHQAVLN